jgi:hypothetical protein
MRFPWIRLLALPALLLTSGCFHFDWMLCWMNNGDLREQRPRLPGHQERYTCEPRDRQQHPGFEGLVLPDSLPEGGAEAEPAGGAEAEPAGGAALVDPAEARRRAMFFPGGGHFHAGEPLRGALLLGGAVGAVGLGAALSGGEEYDHVAHEYRSNRLPLLLGAAAAAGIWAYGVMDAASSAERVNERDGFAVGPVRVRPEPVLGVTPDGSPVVGLQLRVQR